MGLSWFRIWADRIPSYRSLSTSGRATPPRRSLGCHWTQARSAWIAVRVGQIRANRAPLPGRLGSKNDGDGHHIELIRGEVGQDGNREFNGSPKQCIYASRHEPDGGGGGKGG